jgi:hypothetical protein
LEKLEELKFKTPHYFNWKFNPTRQIIGLSQQEQMYAINAKSEIVVFKIPLF